MNIISPVNETIHPRFENVIDNLRKDIETLKDEYATVIHYGLYNSVYRENDLLEQIDELQDTLDELTT